MKVLVQHAVDLEFDPAKMQITDFGIWFVGQIVDSSGTIYYVPGCLEYQAPEIRTFENLQPTPESDMWAVGAIGYELALGQEMDSTTSTFTPIENYIQGQTLDLTQIPDRFSPYVHQIIRDCLNKETSMRLTADGLRTRIRHLLNIYPEQVQPVIPDGWV
jgi:serine/threonine protein kinase